MLECRYKASFRELSGEAAVNKDLEDTVYHFVKKDLKDIVTLQKCEVYKIDMHIKVCIYIACNVDYRKIQTAKRSNKSLIGGNSNDRFHFECVCRDY